MLCTNCKSQIKQGKGFCTSCGTKAPQNVNSQQPQNHYAPQQQQQNQANDYIQSAKTLSKGADRFAKTFFKQPVTTIDAQTISFPQALFFAGIMAITSFFLVYSIAASFIRQMGPWMPSMGFGDIVTMFFQMVLAAAISIGGSMLLIFVFGKLITKATINAKTLFNAVVVGTIPLSLSYLAGALLMFISGHLVIIVIIFGFSSYLYLYPFIVRSALGTDNDKAVYISVCSSATATVIGYLVIWNQIQNELQALAGGLIGGLW